MTIKRQTDKGLPNYSSSGTDTFINENGEELVRIDGTASSEVQTFRLKNEGLFTRYRYYKDQDKWELTTSNGYKYFLGARADNSDVNARIINAEKSSTYAWNLAEINDLNNNQIFYSYDTDQSQTYCTKIQYNFNTSSAGNGHEIEFIYESRSDPVIDYRPTFRLVTAKRLKQIDIKTSGSLVRRYQLDYLTDRTVSMLSRFTQVGSNGVSTLPPAEFSYTQQSLSQTTGLISISGLATASILLSGQNPDNYPSSAEIIDFNGDALPDLYQYHLPTVLIPSLLFTII